MEKIAKDLDDYVKRLNSTQNEKNWTKVQRELINNLTTLNQLINDISSIKEELVIYEALFEANLRN